MNTSHIVFVCGPGHSGTTLLLALLDTHSKIAAIPNETGIFHRVQDDDIVLRSIQNWAVRYTTKPDVRYIAEKTPVHVVYLERLFRLLPEAKVIVIRRDGRDAVLSSADRLGNFLLSVKQWKRLALASRPYEADPRVLHVKYEELVTSPSSELQRICDFLEIHFDLAMLHHHTKPRRWWDEEIRPADSSQPLTGKNHKRNRNWQINQPISSDTSRWRTEMTPEQKEIFKSIAGDALIELGYAEDKSW